jgi:hypothetical protein
VSAERANPTITVQVTQDQRARLEEISVALDRSVGYIVRQAVKAYLESQSHVVLGRTPQYGAQAQASAGGDLLPKVAPGPQPAAPIAPAALRISEEAARAGAITLRPGSPGEKPAAGNDSK